MRAICCSVFAALLAAGISAQSMVIDKIENGLIYAPLLEDMKQVSVNQIYNVYKDRSLFEERVVFEGFVDTVYLSEIRKDGIVFKPVWRGGERLFQPGMYLVFAGFQYGGAVPAKQSLLRPGPVTALIIRASEGYPDGVSRAAFPRLFIGGRVFSKPSARTGNEYAA